jgi:hypothetical protein
MFVGSSVTWVIADSPMLRLQHHRVSIPILDVSRGNETDSKVRGIMLYASS